MKRVLAPSSGLIAFFALAAVVAAVSVAVHVGSYYFEDATPGDGLVTARVGDQLQFYIDDDGGAGKPHSVNVDELGIASGGLRAGSVYTTPPLTEPGTYILYCRLHRVANDHWTTLVVTGAAATPVPTAAPTAAGTQAPTPSAAATTAPGATGTPGGTPTGTSGAPSDSPEGGAEPSESGAPPEPSAAEGSLIPVGVVAPADVEWLRSVWVGLALLVPLLAVAVLATILAGRRGEPRDG